MQYFLKLIKTLGMYYMKIGDLADKIFTTDLIDKILRIFGIALSFSIMPALFIWAVNYFGLLHEIAVVFLYFGGAILLLSLLWLFDCRNKSGCFSGVVLVLPVLLLPLGGAMLLVEYLLQ